MRRSAEARNAGAVQSRPVSRRKPTPAAESARDLRAFYEAQGTAALLEERVISCSEPTITATVVRMLGEAGADLRDIADVGCGANLTYDLKVAEAGTQVTAVDFSGPFLAMAPRHQRIALVQGDVVGLPFRDGHFDAAICSETLEHVPDDDAAVSEIARILRPGGWLFVTVPNLWNLARMVDMVKRLDPTIRFMTGHLREYSRARVRRLLAKHFSIVRFYPVTFGWSGPVGGILDRLVMAGWLERFSKSVALAARRT